MPANSPEGLNECVERGGRRKYRCGRKGSPLAALNLRLKRFCEVLVARSSPGLEYFRHTHCLFGFMMLKNLQALETMRRIDPAPWFSVS